MYVDQVTGVIVDAAIEVHRTPGLLESVYEEALVWELQERNLDVRRQRDILIQYKGNTLSTPLRLDVIINDLVIVECKAIMNYNTIFEAQLRTYLRLSGLTTGLVINFGEQYVKNGIHRVTHDSDYKTKRIVGKP